MPKRKLSLKKIADEIEKLEKPLNTGEIYDPSASNKCETEPYCALGYIALRRGITLSDDSQPTYDYLQKFLNKYGLTTSDVWDLNDRTPADKRNKKVAEFLRKAAEK